VFADPELEKSTTETRCELVGNGRIRWIPPNWIKESHPLRHTSIVPTVVA
jgi:hypothetical protein